MPEPTPPNPDTLRQIEALPRSARPLIICDVDEVILHLIRPLEIFLADRELVFLEQTYKFTGNIAGAADRVPIGADEVRRHLQTFFDAECHRQELVDGADHALRRLTDHWDVLLLTNLPGAHNKPARESLLKSMGIPYPVLTNSGPKGGAVAALAAGRPAPVVFIDDSPTNHRSVHASLPSSVQIQFIADPRFRQSVDREDHVDLLTGDWQQTADFIGDILGEAPRSS